MAIPELFIQDLLNRIDIVEVVDRSVPLKKAGANYVACCPFHNEKTPSFTVSATKQFYHCFGCGAHGTALGFLMEYQGLGFVEAIHDLAKRVGLEVPQDTRHAPDPQAKQTAMDMREALQVALDYYRGQLKQSDQAIAYLKGRGLSGEIAARFKLGYAPAGWQNLAAVLPEYSSEMVAASGLVIDGENGRRYDRFRNRIIFPIHNQKGEVIGFGGRVLNNDAEAGPKYLNSPETPLFQKGHELYGLFQARRAIREAGRVVVVEGYMDVAALAQYGIDYAVATLGTATTPHHIAKLIRQTDNIVFCFDGDAAGHNAAWRATVNALPAVTDAVELGFLFLPPEHDPDSFVRAHGKDAFERALDEAVPLSQYLIQKLGQDNTLQSQEDRVRFINAAEPVLKQLQAPRLGLLLRKRVAELGGISQEELESLLRLDQPRTRASAPPRAARKPPALARRLLQLLLRKPAFAAQLDPVLLTGTSEEDELLRRLLELCTQRPGLDPPALWHATQGLLPDGLRTEISASIMELDEHTMDLEQEFSGALQQLEKIRGKQGSSAAELLTLAQEKGLRALTPEQRTLLQSSRWGHGGKDKA